LASNASAEKKRNRIERALDRTFRRLAPRYRLPDNHFKTKEFREAIDEKLGNLGEDLQAAIWFSELPQKEREAWLRKIVPDDL
jgi:hypothetical protein